MAIGALQMILGLIFLTLSCCCYSGNLKNICDLDLGCDIFSKKIGPENETERTNREQQEFAKKRQRESDNNTADAMIMARKSIYNNLNHEQT